MALRNDGVVIDPACPSPGRDGELIQRSPIRR